jgi:hypothetical protein
MAAVSVHASQSSVSVTTLSSPMKEGGSCRIFPMHACDENVLALSLAPSQPPQWLSSRRMPAVAKGQCVPLTDHVQMPLLMGMEVHAVGW